MELKTPSNEGLAAALFVAAANAVQEHDNPNDIAAAIAATAHIASAAIAAAGIAASVIATAIAATIIVATAIAATAVIAAAVILTTTAAQEQEQRADVASATEVHVNILLIDL